MAFYNRQKYIFHTLQKNKRQINLDSVKELSVEVQIVNHLMNEEKAFIVHQFLHSMKEPYKEVFTLRTFGELPFEKIGRLFGKSAGWARVTFYRARKQITEYMEGINDERN